MAHQLLLIVDASRKLDVADDLAIEICPERFRSYCKTLMRK
jgi:hypothetical protein